MTKHQPYMTTLNQLSLKSLHMLAVISQSKDMQHAADELCVSPSALSHQMNRLEEKLGKPLFVKEGRHQKLLPEAKIWASKISESFANIEKSTDDFLNKHSRTINLGIHSAFAFNRVTPQLGLWLQQQPSLDVRIRMLNCGDEPEKLNLDAFLSTPINNKLYDCELLASEEYIPVCNAQLYSQLQSRLEGLEISEVMDIVPMLELDGVNSWQTWCSHFCHSYSPNSVQYFSHTILILQAVLAGQGVALLDRHLIKPQLKSGELVQLYEEPMAIEGLTHNLVVKSNKMRDKHMATLRTWLKTLFV